mgnify:CR=1 FL=1
MDTDALITEFPDGIRAIDTGYTRPAMTASHLLVEKGRAAFVDTGPNSAVPRLMAALEAAGLAPADVDLVCLTHVHLDHAGGAGLERRFGAGLDDFVHVARADLAGI